MKEALRRFWHRVCSLPVWRRVFPLPAWAAAVLLTGCGAALVWVFVTGREQWWPAYGLYALSAWALAAFCIRLPGAVRQEKAWLHRHPRVRQLLQNKELKFKAELYAEQFINFGYGIFKIGTGVAIGSAWVGADGIYNLVQALIQLFQILRRRRPGSLPHQWRSYRLCGGLILLLHLTLIGIVFQSVNWNRVEEHGEITILVTAVFAFYKLISAFIDLAKDRKHPHPIDSSVRMLELSQAIFAIFALQTGLLHIFGTGERWEHWLNLAVGCTVCMLTAATGVYMIRRANRELNTLRENEHGESIL